MREYTVSDDFGRRHIFKGQKLVHETTDTVAGTKPQWADVNAWRTEGGSYVVERQTHYRVRHLTEKCEKAEGYELMTPTQLDTYACPECNPSGIMEGEGFAQADRISVEVYHTPQALIESFRVNNRYSNLAKTILADISEQDNSVDRVWNTVLVP